MKVIKFILNVCLLVAAIFLGYSYITKQGIFQVRHHDSTNIIPGESYTDTSFTLTNQDGHTVNSHDFQGKYMLVLFGFSSCESICPAELGLASEVLSQLGNDANKLQVIFITIDPINDTVEKLKKFHDHFDSRIQMLTGNTEDIKQIIQNYNIYVGQRDKDNQISHSTIMYILDTKGKYLTYFYPDLQAEKSQADELLSIIKQYL
ncbi:SCO family protein [Ehrlichia muris]|uniref:Photosynthetic protein synthase II n=1 Tax=Ehrlichia muris AS145 TaxID=1423892 RepID=V9R832_9RICK|nr:SCO family protein [Ehrlichia muris]AHC38986.1 photosynthetic protein synthase II [Ehrlichia muris AS145]